MGDKALSFVVTGATGHLGQSIVKSLLAVKGAQVLATSRESSQLLSNGHTTDVYPGVDLTSVEGAESLAQIVSAAVTSQVSVINCIGYFPDYRPFLEIGHAEADKIFRVNFLSVYFTALSLIPVLIGRGGGDFISFSTLSASEAYPRMAAFDSAKAALEQFTRHLANEHGGQGINANVLALATLRTAEEIRLKPHGDHANWIDPAEVALLVRQFVTGDFSLISGNILRCYHYSEGFYRTSYIDRIER